MSQRERLNCPPLLALASGVGGALYERSVLHGGYGRKGTRDDVWRTGKGGSRSSFDCPTTCGLSVKQSVRTISLCEGRKNPKLIV